MGPTPTSNRRPARPDRLGTSTTRRPPRRPPKPPTRHRLSPSRPAPATHDLPTLSPAERFYPALTAANTARAAAAGRAEHICYPAQMSIGRLPPLTTTPTDRNCAPRSDDALICGANLDRAELAAAASYAAADSRTHRARARPNNQDLETDTASPGWLRRPVSRRTGRWPSAAGSPDDRNPCGNRQDHRATIHTRRPDRPTRA